MGLLKLTRTRNELGDTIIEVLVAMTVLAIILGTAYASSTRSLQTGVEAGNRNQALGYAQEQVEYLKDAASQTPSAVAKYQIPSAFCIPSVGAEPLASTKDICKKYKASQYSITINYGTSKVFTVTANWEAIHTTSPNELKLYYRVAGS